MIRRLKDASEQDRIDNHSNRQREGERYEKAREIVGIEAGGNEIFHSDLLFFVLVDLPKARRRLRFRIVSDCNSC